MLASILKEVGQIPSASAGRLGAALAADTAFLASLGVMDYSLLLGVDRQNRQLVVGIIDFVRQVRASLELLPPPPPHTIAHTHARTHYGTSGIMWSS